MLIIINITICEIVLKTYFGVHPLMLLKITGLHTATCELDGLAGEWIRLAVKGPNNNCNYNSNNFSNLVDGCCNTLGSTKYFTLKCS